jgi:hypothetical protein
MKRTLLVLTVLAGAAVYSLHAPAGQAQQPAQGRGAGPAGQGRGAAPGQGRGFTPPPGAVEIPYEATAGIVKLPQDVGTLGEVVGVARNSKGDFFIYTRAEKQQIFQFDRNGKFIKEIGKGGYFQEFAHVVRVDREDNLWAVDEGSNLIVKFNPAGEITLVLGRKWESVEGPPWLRELEDLIEEAGRGAPPPEAAGRGGRGAASGGGRGRGGAGGGGTGASFGRPTDVTWDLQGNIFIADGYTNSRVVKFSKDGDLVKSVGVRGTGPLEFNTPHTIASDSKGNIYVGDRGNNRIQVLDSDLNFKTEWRGFGAPWAICVTPAPNEWLYTADPNGHIYKLDMTGKIVGYFGRAGKDVGEWQWVHEIHCQSENELYIGEIQNWRMQRLVLKPAAR